MPNAEWIQAGYRDRPRPNYDDDPDDGVVWQPDLYSTAQTVAEVLGASSVIDIGCGRGSKLAALHPSLQVIGLDYGPNIAYCRKEYPFGSWIEHDLDGEGALPLTEDQLRGAVMVAGDVVEHLVHPERLLHDLSEALNHASVLLISTPERHLVRGIRSSGPPQNECHVREWSLREFQAFLAANGMPVHSIGLMRSNDRTDEAHTILAAVPGRGADLTSISSTLIDFRPPPSRRRTMVVRGLRAARILLRGS